jgi:hypothetical protein
MLDFERPVKHRFDDYASLPINRGPRYVDSPRRFLFVPDESRNVDSCNFSSVQNQSDPIPS